MEEKEAYEELVQKPHRMQRQHYSLSDSENLSGCGIEEVMVSRSDGCEVPSIDDQLRFSCESRTHISCHSLPTPDPPNNQLIYRQHSLPSYYPTDPPPLPAKTGSKSNLPSHTLPFSTSPPFSLCPPHPLKNYLLSNLLPLPIKAFPHSHSQANPPIPPKSFNLYKQKNHQPSHISFNSESLNTHNKSYKENNKNHSILTRPPDYYNQKWTKDSQPTEPQPPHLLKHSFPPHQLPKPPQRPLQLQLSQQPPSVPSYKHHQSPLHSTQSSPPLLKSSPPLPQSHLPSPQKLLSPQIPPQFQPQKLSPPQLPPLHLPPHRTIFPCCHLKTSLSLHNSSINTPHHQHLNHQTSPPSHHHHPFPTNQLQNDESCSQMTGRYETSDSLVYEDVNVLRWVI